MFKPARVLGTGVHASPCAGYKCSSQPVCTGWLEHLCPAQGHKCWAHVHPCTQHTCTPCAGYKCPCQPVCWVQVFMPARVLGTSVHASPCAECYSVHASPCAGYKCSSQPGYWVQVFMSVRVLGTRFMSVHVLSTIVHTLIQGSYQPGC